MTKVSGIKRVKFVQSGGFAGLLRGCELVAASLTADERKQLEELIGQADLSKAAHSPDKPSASASRAADARQYRLEIETAEGRYEALLSESQVDAKSQPLLKFLASKSKPVKP
jgi:hypothetical protein